MSREFDKEIYNAGEIYRTSFCNYQRSGCAEYVGLVILEAELEDQSRLEKMWEWEIE